MQGWMQFVSAAGCSVSFSGKVTSFKFNSQFSVMSRTSQSANNPSMSAVPTSQASILFRPAVMSRQHGQWSFRNSTLALERLGNRLTSFKRTSSHLPQQKRRRDQFVTRAAAGIRACRALIRQARQSATVETDILQILADVDFDQRDQLLHVPCLDLIGDERRHAALLLGNHGSQHSD